jgi:molybdopterin converting factor subunit 1
MTTAMQVRLLFFAVLRDITGKTEDEITLPAGSRAADVWQSLRSSYPKLAGYDRPPMTAINETYASAESVLRDGDVLAFIPPVAGG